MGLTAEQVVFIYEFKFNFRLGHKYYLVQKNKRVQFTINAMYDKTRIQVTEDQVNRIWNRKVYCNWTRHLWEKEDMEKNHEQHPSDKYWRVCHLDFVQFDLRTHKNRFKKALQNYDSEIDREAIATTLTYAKALLPCPSLCVPPEGDDLAWLASPPRSRAAVAASQGDELQWMRE